MKTYTIALELNDGKFYLGGNTGVICPHCDSVIGEIELSEVVFEPKIKKYDVSYSYDGVLIANSKFKKICESMKLRNIIFQTVNNDLGLYAMSVNKVVKFDFEARKTRFVNPCDLCGNFESIVGATPAFLLEDLPKENIEIYKTDIEFGSGRNKHSLLVVNEVTKKALEATEIKGLRFKECKILK